MAKNVLIIDDSAPMRKIVMRGSRRAGIEAADFQAAGDGVAGPRAGPDGNFDLILGDVNMPNQREDVHSPLRK